MIFDHIYGNSNYLDVSFGDFSTGLTNALALVLELPGFDDALHYETYTWTIEIIPGVTDFVVGQVRFDTFSVVWSNRYSGDGATVPSACIVHVSASAN